MPTIRPARAADGATLARLTGELGYPVTTEAMGLRVGAILQRPREHALLVAVAANDEPIGWIHVERVDTLETAPMAGIAGLVVGEGWRSNGIGAALLAAGEAWARDQGLAVMQVRSRTTRERAHRFYERHGYARVKISAVFRKPLG
jgi:GNAT superfamily N-acetyltransferase